MPTSIGGGSGSGAGGGDSPDPLNWVVLQQLSLSVPDNTNTRVAFDPSMNVTHTATGAEALPSWAELDGSNYLLITERGVYLTQVQWAIPSVDEETDATGLRSLFLESGIAGAVSDLASMAIPARPGNTVDTPLMESTFFVIPTDAQLPFHVGPHVYQTSGATLDSSLAMAIQRLT